MVVIVIRYNQSQGFQYFSSLPVLLYLQAVRFIKIETIVMNILLQQKFYPFYKAIPLCAWKHPCFLCGDIVIDTV
jgi:hypothetical protein